MKKSSIFLWTVGFLLCIVLEAGAASLASVSGSWQSINGGDTPPTLVTDEYEYDTRTVSFGNTSESRALWGTPSAVDGPKTGLGFTGIAPPGQTFDFGDAFIVGQLQHYNYAVSNAALGATLRISLMFSQPAITSSFDFYFDVEETPNREALVPITDPVNDDFVTIPEAMASNTFTVDGISYTLELLGFGDTLGNYVDAFRTTETRTSSTLLWARIVTDPPPTEGPPTDPVPEPSSITLLGLGMLGLFGVNRRRRLG